MFTYIHTYIQQTYIHTYIFICMYVVCTCMYVIVHALNQYLAQLSHLQIAFSVKQAKPKTVNDAVRLTESYLQPSKPGRVAHLYPIKDPPVPETTMIASARVDDPLQLLLERMDRIETELKAVGRPYGVQEQQNSSSSNRIQSSGDRKTRQKPLVCWNCQGEGHIS